MENGWAITSSQFNLEGIGFRFFLNVYIIKGKFLITRLKIQIFV
ncbi:hypothetical protein LEP1GSC016_3269 [Leptospira borgpetersenii serovar Hardjo-bovis str. Sponselee]|uniref:Uncharacterized protein n=1 Tax=Leptospira borgpetersenii serovar Hardjo-bovis str. Sponselee TaxID=1303729 RepID=M6BVX3_LEPBO|nr:hypothetical protein LEP1GSC016_3269 [Leptospira borgpetersenii serovar Hardjo-bovis str. Sponselee]